MQAETQAILLQLAVQVGSCSPLWLLGFCAASGTLEAGSLARSSRYSAALVLVCYVNTWARRLERSSLQRGQAKSTTGVKAKASGLTPLPSTTCPALTPMVWCWQPAPEGRGRGQRQTAGKQTRGEPHGRGERGRGTVWAAPAGRLRPLPPMYLQC